MVSRAREDFDPVTEKALRLILNYNRRSFTSEEMTESLDFIAEKKGESPTTISERIGIPYRTTMRARRIGI